MGFCDDQLRHRCRLWEKMLAHRFLTDTRDGKIDPGAFARWLQQDFLFVRAAIPFVAGLITRAPRKHWSPLQGVISALEKELHLFEERANVAGVGLEPITPAFVTHAYQQFMLATVANRSYSESFTLLLVAERAYFDSWSVVRSGLNASSPWMPFVDRWAGEDFADYVRFLEQELDLLACAAGERTLKGMRVVFDLTIRYEIAFWEMALAAEDWPGCGPASMYMV